jgi:DMSO/TMAO reductase YedYZ molybdopterin-dependent catalytic subunit
MDVEEGVAMKLPPGQLRQPDFPRFGLGGRPPRVPTDPRIVIAGEVVEHSVATADLADLPRHQVTADFHCVSGWTATDLHWEGVAFRDFYRTVVEPRLRPGAAVTHVVLEGLDHYRSVALLEDLLDPDVLVADRLDGRPLDSDHGAPVRLLSPAQYGYISTKHLARIELHESEPRMRYHPRWQTHYGLQLVKPHPRARVWREERHRYLPGPLVRPVYHRLISHFRKINAGPADDSGQLPGGSA